MRKSQTEEENLLWAKIRLAIELDGEQHKKEGAMTYDKVRDLYLASVGIRVLRFWNIEIKNNIEQVMDRIKNLALSLQMKGESEGVC